MIIQVHFKETMWIWSFGARWIRSTYSVAVFTLEDEQIIWTNKSSSICPSDVNLCRTVVDLFRLDGQIVLEKSSFQTTKYQTIWSSKHLFVPFAHQTICSSERPIWDNLLGSITSRCSGKEPALLPRTPPFFSWRVDQTRESGGNRAWQFVRPDDFFVLFRVKTAIE